MRRLTLWVLVFGLLAGCASDSGRRGGVRLSPVAWPEWAVSGEHPDFPEDTHLTAWGLAQTGFEARDLAREGLEERICQWALERGANALRGTQFAALATERKNWFSPEDFGAAVQGDFASNGFEAVAVCAIERDELSLRAGAMLEAGRENFAASVPPPRTIEDLSRRVELWSQRFLVAARLVALRLLADGELERDALAAAEAAALELRDTPGLMLVEQQGSGQHAVIQGGTPERLGIAARYRGAPAAHAPLIWRIEAPASGLIGGDDQFDAAGKAWCEVHQIVSPGDRYAYVSAALDLDALAGCKLGLAPPTWRWQIELASRENTVLLLTVVEKEGDEVAASPVLDPALREWCKLHSITVADTLSEAEEALYVLEFSGVVRVSLATDGSQVMARAEGTLSLTERETRTTIFRRSPSVLLRADAEEDRSALMQRALAEAAADALLDFAPRILTILPDPQPEQRP